MASLLEITVSNLAKDAPDEKRFSLICGLLDGLSPEYKQQLLQKVMAQLYKEKGDRGFPFVLPPNSRVHETYKPEDQLVTYTVYYKTEEQIKKESTETLQMIQGIGGAIGSFLEIMSAATVIDH
jgi:hypothetical protein